MAIIIFKNFSTASLFLDIFVIARRVRISYWHFSPLSCHRRFERRQSRVTTDNITDFNERWDRGMSYVVAASILDIAVSRYLQEEALYPLLWGDEWLLSMLLHYFRRYLYLSPSPSLPRFYQHASLFSAINILLALLDDGRKHTIPALRIVTRCAHFRLFPLNFSPAPCRYDWWYFFLEWSRRTQSPQIMLWRASPENFDDTAFITPHYIIYWVSASLISKKGICAAPPILFTHDVSKMRIAFIASTLWQAPPAAATFLTAMSSPHYYMRSARRMPWRFDILMMRSYSRQ